MRSSSGSSWFLVVIAAVMVLGHICALPFHAHAGAITTHEDRPEGDSDHHPGHGGSCDLLKASPPADAAPGAVTTGSVVVVIRDRFEVPAAQALRATGASPPLFLLHAALLI